VTEGQCRQHSEKRCRNRGNYVCETRTEAHDKYAEVKDVACVPETKRMCWKYNKNVCKRVETPTSMRIEWDDEVDSGNTEENKECYEITKCRLEDAIAVGTYQAPETKIDIVMRSEKRQRVVTVPQPARKVERTVWKVVYKQVCSNVNMHVCANPVCTDTDCVGKPGRRQLMEQEARGGTGCQIPPYEDICCPKVDRKVCKQVPVKVPHTVWKVIQPPPITKIVWDVVQVPEKKYSTVMVTKTFNVSYTKCFEFQEEECRTFNDIVVKKVHQVKNVPLKDISCQWETQEEEHCAEVVVAEKCTEKLTKRPINITKRVCRETPSCFTVNSNSSVRRKVKKCVKVPRPVKPVPVPDGSSCGQTPDGNTFCGGTIG